ncbi:MAG: methionine--tRNA ligase [Deltaproteobacteria bacterium]|jgi:methionyl-tRNA synthetase|nr:methionine--tRNA ligase [Deltaproteobacteria bacterium]
MTYYVTTPIYYVNAKPHLGHAYTTIVCDTMARFHRLNGEDAYFLTGTDEHGDKIAEAAKREGVPPQIYVDYISSHFKFTWPKFNIRPDDFIRTTEPRHKEVVSRFLDKVHDSGDIYFGKYGGLYCVGCERFYTEKELVDGLCPDHKTPPRYIAEKNYFFRMGKYQDWLIDHIKKNPDFIRPERYRNEVLSFLSEPLEDLCISRPKTRLTWGIDIPFDRDYVTYVWFDALINYISALGWPDGETYGRYWPHVEHTVAKDILKPHAIFWPTMLRSAGVPVYRYLNVHGYWQMDESKMSKSVGNVVDIFTLRDEFGTDALRYFLMREMTFGLDSEFSYQRIFDRYNADLANDFGNLWQRSVSMLVRYSGGVVSDGALAELSRDAEWEGKIASLFADYRDHFLNMRPSEALKRVWDFIRSLNKFIDTESPWTLAKDPGSRERLDLVMATLVKGLAVAGALVSPVMPGTSDEIWRRLGLAPGTQALDSAALTAALCHGRPVEVGEAFFARAEKEGGTRNRPAKPKDARPASAPVSPSPDVASGPSGPAPAASPAPAQALAASAAAVSPPPGAGTVAAKASPADAGSPAAPAAAPSSPAPDGPPSVISYDDFRKLDLRTALILDAEPVKKSDKLLKLTVEVGEETRTIVAGIRKHFDPETLKGQRMVIVANLAPRELMGIKSHGMVLCSSGADTLALLVPSREMPSGSPVS